MGDDAPACIDDGTLAAFAEGGTERHSQARIEAHLAECGECRAVLAGVARNLRSGIDATTFPCDREGERVCVAPGTCVGRYVVEGLIGHGAMGSVYAARDPALNRQVALKLLRAEALSDEARQHMRARLLREAQAMARLSHPEVITAYDVGAFGDQLFVAMEYVDGGTLRQWRSAKHRTHREILAVYERAGSGLAAAHSAGLVHRDFKPDNVLVGTDGRVRVTDFGLARSVADIQISERVGSVGQATGEGATNTSLTRTGMFLGTPAYMAPEQLRGRAADARSDVFSFCVAFYEALYGERPFAGATVHELRAAIEAGAIRRAPVMAPVPRWLRNALVRGLRAEPAERYASMQGLLDAFRAGHRASERHLKGILAFAAAVLGPGLVAAAARVGRPIYIAHDASMSDETSSMDPGAQGPRPASGNGRDYAPGSALMTALRGTPVWIAPRVAPPEFVSQSSEGVVPQPEPLRDGSRSLSARMRPLHPFPPAAPIAHSSAAAPLIGTNGAFILE